MAEKTNEFATTGTAEEQKPRQPNAESKTSADKWREFVDSTTLHGIRYVFMKRHVLIRLLWLVLLLTSGGYYILTVYIAFNKYFSRPISTVFSTKHLVKMDFPAVTICSLSEFSRSKIFMTDKDPLFASKGFNITSCAVTSGVRGYRPCGLSLLCCCTSDRDIEDLPNCTTQYRQDLSAVVQKSGHRVDFEELYLTYSQDITALHAGVYKFGRKCEKCSAKDFVPILTSFGMCYTFNSGADGKVKTVDAAGISSGLTVMLDAQTHDYFLGRFSAGFKVLVHGQGEYIDGREGTNVGTGQHAIIALSQKRVCFLVSLCQF